MNDNFRDFTEGQDDDNYMQEQEGEEKERQATGQLSRTGWWRDTG